MKLIVMGAGYVGMALLRYLQKGPDEIYITTTSPERVEALQPYGKQVIVLDSKDNKNLEELIDACDGMIILVASKNAHSHEETYLNTAKRISGALKDRKKPFYIIYTSSTSVCDGAEGEWITEETPLNPQSEKAKILLESEHCYLESGMPACILRLGGIYGPGRELIDRARRFSGREFPGAGNETTNHIHLEDIVAAIDFCLKHALTGVHHLVNDDHRTRIELYSTICESLKLPPPLWNSNVPQSQKRGDGKKISNQKIKKAGFTPAHNSYTHQS